MNHYGKILLGVFTTAILVGCTKKETSPEHAQASEVKANKGQVVLNIGDQKGNMRAQLEASGALKKCLI